MSFWKEFKAFAIKGNVVDLAVGVVIGSAFGKIVTSLVDDLIMPLIGIISGGGEKFTDKYIVLKRAKAGEVYKSLEQAKTAGANVFAYGHFIQTIVDFLIIAFFIFLAIRAIHKLQTRHDEAQAAAPAPPPTTSEQLLTEIRDLLKK